MLTRLSRVVTVFRLINVKERRLVEFRDMALLNFQYATLSYVWGNNQKLQLTSANLKTLQLAGALGERTSRTITDAITFSSMMGLQYLWVDALCI